MKVELKGYETINYVNKEGKEVKGFNLYFEKNESENRENEYGKITYKCYQNANNVNYELDIGGKYEIFGFVEKGNFRLAGVIKE